MHYTPDEHAAVVAHRALQKNSTNTHGLLNEPESKMIVARGVIAQASAQARHDAWHTAWHNAPEHERPAIEAASRAAEKKLIHLPTPSNRIPK
jgi:hypothetical protein